MPVRTIRRPDAEAVVQFSIFAENKVGRLNEVILALAAADVHIMALCTIDTTDSAIIRIVPDYPEEAERVLREKHFAFDTTHVLAVEIVGEHELKKITCSLLQAEINMHYYYPFLFRPNGKYGLVMRLEDQDLAEDVLRRNGLTVLSRNDIAR